MSHMEDVYKTLINDSSIRKMWDLFEANRPSSYEEFKREYTDEVANIMEYIKPYKFEKRRNDVLCAIHSHLISYFDKKYPEPVINNAKNANANTNTNTNSNSNSNITSISNDE